MVGKNPVSSILAFETHAVLLCGPLLLADSLLCSKRFLFSPTRCSAELPRSSQSSAAFVLFVILSPKGKESRLDKKRALSHRDFHPQHKKCFFEIPSFRAFYPRDVVEPRRYRPPLASLFSNSSLFSLKFLPLRPVGYGRPYQPTPPIQSG